MHDTDEPIPHDIDWSAEWGAWLEDGFDPDVPPINIDRLEDFEGYET